MPRSFIPLLVIIACYVSYSQAIRCWTCSSDLDPQCADPFNNTTPRFNLHHTLTDCSTQSGPSYPFLRGKSVCKKIRQVVNGELVVIRSCAWLSSDNEDVGECAKSTTPSYIRIEFCETCDGDACNNAPIAASTLSALLIPAIAYFLTK